MTEFTVFTLSIPPFFSLLQVSSIEKRCNSSEKHNTEGTGIFLEDKPDEAASNADGKAGNDKFIIWNKLFHH